ncbi:hypothetical protein M413DRAFT_29331 [Hebeloma cylindrosporum]|uniref:Protein kinase domain-containing protein n=1 Tax=Hebeloma cylindrosporum TaxID=76867 RepID=A0A0C3C5Z7_HEBCY|nr:hypothetical protein M413DRAFT_29331 [Hebeloma cylindrosporum h7]
MSILKIFHSFYLNFRLFALRRSNLPVELQSWRTLALEQRYRKAWDTLAPILQHRGFTLWRQHINELNQKIDSPPLPNSYSFLPANLSNPAVMVMRFGVSSGLLHAVRGKDNKDYIVRVMTSGGEGHNHLRLVRRLSSAFPDNTLSNTHILPMVLEVQFKDITLGFFPKAQYPLDRVLSNRQSTVEDAVYMILQALEAVVFIHDKQIAHRDLFFGNFVIDFLPGSMDGRCWMRPRVYMIDFETAVEFSADTPSENRLCNGFPISAHAAHLYKRPKPDELTHDPLLYCPFRLDIWQFGYDLLNLFSKTNMPELDALWRRLTAANPQDRPTAQEALDELGAFVRRTPPEHLHVPFTDF